VAPDTPHEQIVREAFAHMNARRADEIKQTATADVEAFTRMSSVTGKPYVGHEGIDRWLSDIDEQFSSFTLEVEDVAERGEGRVLASGRAEVTGRGSELPWREDVHYVFVFDGDKISRMQMFLERGEAEEMAEGGPGE
jgi:ketosteroid isomerase-like protein